jgi:signal transduction histidine kinase
MNDSAEGRKGLEFLSGSSEMDGLIRSADWSQNPLGSPQNWPNSLKIMVRMMLDSRYAIWIGWGPELSFLYNDAYARMTLGKKHPWALGKPAREVWAEAWDTLGLRVEEVVRHRQATYDEDLLLLLERSGYPEETYHTFSYSPLPDDHDGFGGLLCIVVEDTARYLAERRLKTQRDLAAEITEVRTEKDLCTAIRTALDINRHDFPFSMLYLTEDAGETWRRACYTGIADDSPGAPKIASRAELSSLWPINKVLDTNEAVIVEPLPEAASGGPLAPWGTPPKAALVMPIAQQGQAIQAGVLIAGLNVHRPIDEPYLAFFEMVRRQIEAGLADVRAYENEQKRAEQLAEIDRAKTLFFSNTSHEFRTPLSLMLGPLEEALARSNHAEAVLRREELELACRNGHRLLKLVNSLLDFSRIEAGRVQSVFEPVDLASYTAELASSFHSAMEQAGLTYIVACEPVSESVYIDREMWEKIVLNLISNAFKYTLAGQVAVALRRAPDGDGVELSVRDTGVGIPKAELPRIFERFHRIEGQTGRTAEGSGIGLALVNELVRLHAGHLSVESAVGRGSTFKVWIPTGASHLPAERVSRQRAPASTRVGAHAFVAEALRWLANEPTPELGISSDFGPVAESVAEGAQRARVLIADDNADMRDYLRRLLSERYEVEVAVDGVAALELMRRTRPDLLLSDVMMPRLDGFGLLREIRADAELRETPVVLLSARAGEEASVEGLERGADDYLVKPFSARELLARIATNLDFARRQRQAKLELQRINASLEQQVVAEVAERMKAEEAYRQAQKMEVVGQLTGGIAHDFNNLLQVISGNLHVIQQRSAAGQLTPEDAGRLTEAAIRGADRAASLTRRLLAFSRRQPLDPKPLDINRLVAGMIELLRRTLGESIKIETRTDKDLWMTWADANELENALLNLAINARDAMPNGGRLTIATANEVIDAPLIIADSEVRTGDYVSISVIDNGMGMTKEVAEKAFEPFFTTKELGQGTGLGLSQVYGFVRQSGGYVSIDSAPSAGATVKIYLPRMKAETANKTEKSPNKLAEASPAGQTILLVEDDTDVRELTARILRDLGYVVFEASDGASALGQLQAGSQIDLIMTDVGLPGTMNGRQLADHVRTQKPEQKVLFVSGYERNTIVHDGRLDPGVELLTKPFTVSQLANKLRQLLAR